MLMDGQRTTDACLYYKLTYEPSAQWAKKNERKESDLYYSHDPKFSDRQDWANNVDPDLSAGFGHITLCKTTNTYM